MKRKQNFIADFNSLNSTDDSRLINRIPQCYARRKIKINCKSISLNGDENDLRRCFSKLSKSISCEDLCEKPECSASVNRLVLFRTVAW